MLDYYCLSLMCPVLLDHYRDYTTTSIRNNSLTDGIFQNGLWNVGRPLAGGSLLSKSVVTWFTGWRTSWPARSSTWPIRSDCGSATERHKTQKSLTSEFLFDAPWQCRQQLQGAHPICQQNSSIAKQPPGLAGQFLLLDRVSGMHFSHRL